MAIWKLEPVEPREHHWRGSEYVGPVIVRAQDEAGARLVAADALGRTPELVLGLEAREPWSHDSLATCERLEESDFDEEGPDTILGPDEALARAHPSQTDKG